MRVLFFSYFFKSNMTYQENMLMDECIRAGHDVIMVTSDIQCDPETNRFVRVQGGEDVERVVRLRSYYSGLLPFAIRMERVHGLSGILSSFSPDVIFVNAIQTLELKTIVKYKTDHTRVKVFYNSHADYYTSGTNWISRVFLHGMFYRRLINKYVDYAEKVFYVSEGCHRFMAELYKLPESKIEPLYLGGTISDDEQIEVSRKKINEELNLNGNEVVFIQAGKMDRAKHLRETIKSFSMNKDNDFILLIIGTIIEDKSEIMEMIEKDDRIAYLGWMDGAELGHYLEAGDVYLQPGKVSAILQNAVCYSCAIVAYNHPDYSLLVNGNGWLIDDYNELDTVFSEISNNKGLIDEMKATSKRIASEYLDNSQLINKFLKMGE